MMQKNEISEDDTDAGNDKRINRQSRRRNGEELKERAIARVVYDAKLKTAAKLKTQKLKTQRAGNCESGL